MASEAILAPLRGRSTQDRASELCRIHLMRLGEQGDKKDRVYYQEPRPQQWLTRRCSRRYGKFTTDLSVASVTLSVPVPRRGDRCPPRYPWS